jgi:WD40 repeat protein
MSINFDGKYLVTAGKDRMIKLWDARDNKLIDTFKGHRDTITGLKF